MSTSANVGVDPGGNREATAALTPASCWGMVLLDDMGRVETCDPAFERLFQYSKAEIEGNILSDLIVPPDLLPSSRELCERGVGGEVISTATRRRRRDGVLTDVEIHIFPLALPGGVTRVIHLYRESTEPARAQAALAQAEQHRLASLVAEVGTALTGAESLQGGLQRCAEILVRNIDAAFARVWTLNQDESILKLAASAGIYTRIDGTFSRIPVGKFKIGRIAESGEPLLTANVQDGSWEGDPEWARRKGLVAFAGYPLKIEDRVMGVVAAFTRQPLTEATLQALASIADSLAQFIERKRAEEELRLTQFSIEHAEDSIFWMDSDGQIVYANPAASRALNFSREELLSLSIPDINPTLTREGWVPLWDGLRQAGSLNFETKHRTRDGRVFPVEVTANFLAFHGKEYSFAFAHDVTRRKQIEARLKAQYGATSALAAAETMVEATPRLLQAICESLGWEFGVHWDVDERASVLRSAGLWSSPSVALHEVEALVHDITFAPGVGMCGGVWASCQPRWVTGLTAHGLKCADTLERNGLRSSAAVPVVAAGNVLGVIQLFSSDALAPDPQVLETLTTVASQIGPLIERQRAEREKRQAEEALRRSEEKARLLFSTIPNPAYVFDLDTLDFLEVNDAAVEHYGFSREEFLRMKTTEIRSPEEAERLKAFLENPKISFPAAGQWKHRTRDGRLIDVEVNHQQLEYDGHRACIVVIQDVTERERAEQQSCLQTAALQSAANGIMITDRDGTILWANPAFTRLTGYSIAEALGRKPSILKSGAHALAFYRQLWDTVLAGDVWEGELINRRKDGAIYHEEMTITPVRDKLGAITHFISIQQDITQRKVAERKLAQRTAYLNKLIQISPLAIVVLDSERRVEMANAGFEKLYQYSPQEAQGRDLEALIVPEEARAECEGFFQECQMGGTAHATTRRRRKDGSYVEVEMFGVALVMEGARRGTLALYLDITERKLAELASRDSEQRYRTLFEQNFTAVFRLTMDGRVLDCNAALAGILGYESPEEARELVRNGSLYDSADFEILKTRLIKARLVNRTGLTGIEIRLRRKDGALAWVTGNASLAEPARGNDAFISGTLIDITKHKEAELSLQQERELLRALMDNIPDYIYFKDRDSRFIRANTAITKAFSLSDPGFLVGTTDFDYFDAEHAQQAFDDEQEVIRTGKPLTGKEEKELWPDGRESWVSTTKMPLLTAYGEIVGTFGVSRDITRQKRAEMELVRYAEDLEAARAAQEKHSSELAALVEELANERDLLRTVMDNIPDYIFYKDRSSRFLRTNLAHARVLGLDDPHEAVGKTDFQFFAEAEARRYFRDEQQVMETGKALIGQEARIQHLDGQSRWCSTTEVPIRDTQGRVTGLVGITRDITERKAVEEMLKAKEAAESASRVKSQFLASMSHEIRTPINGVIGMTKLLLDTELSTEQRRYAQVANTCGGTLLGVINDILDFSKIEARKLVLEVIDFDLREMLAGTVEMLAVPASDKGLELNCWVAADTPPLVRGDPGRLRQILLNLVGNAVKFTHQGEVTIRVEVDGEEESSITLRFAVADSGIGIPEDRVATLFSPFVQADGSTTRRYGGTGLGLAISKDLVALMGGEIGVQSEREKGSTFWFTVVLQKQKNNVDSSAGRANEFSGVKVLVVDAHATSQKVMSTLLQAWNCRSVHAPDGAAALDLLREAVHRDDPFAVAFLDNSMPAFGGIELAKRISADSTLDRTALVLMTSATVGGDGAPLEGVRLAGRLAKPVLENRLYSAMNRALGRIPAAEEGQGASPLVSPHGKPPRANARILVVEDIASNREVASGFLSKLGYHAEMVTNGAEALAEYRTGRFDLILMDCEMPEMDGYEATRQIRAQEIAAGKPRMPIVALTAHAISGDRNECMKAGMDDYLCKPIDLDKLAEALAAWLPAVPPPSEPAAAAVAVSASGVVASAPAIVPAASGPGAFDEKELLARMGQDRALAGKVVARFLHDAPALLEQLRASWEAGDQAETRRRSHGIKGAAATISAGELRDVALKMESAAQAGDLAAAGEFLPSLNKKCEELRAILQQADWV